MRTFEPVKNSLHYAKSPEDCVTEIKKMVKEGVNFTSNQWRAMVTDVIKTHFDNDPVALMRALFTADDQLVRNATKNRTVGFVKATAIIMVEHFDRSSGTNRAMLMQKNLRGAARTAHIRRLKSVVDELAQDRTQMHSTNDDLRSAIYQLKEAMGEQQTQKWLNEFYPDLIVMPT